MSVQDLSGQTLGAYELRSLLGIGGMATVYRACRTAVKREVAVKVLPANLAQQPGYIERFNREAETTARPKHLHIIPIHDYGTDRGITYVVMRLLSGGFLAERPEQLGIPSLKKRPIYSLDHQCARLCPWSLRGASRPETKQYPF